MRLHLNTHINISNDYYRILIELNTPELINFKSEIPVVLKDIQQYILQFNINLTLIWFIQFFFLPVDTVVLNK